MQRVSRNDRIRGDLQRSCFCCGFRQFLQQRSVNPNIYAVSDSDINPPDERFLNFWPEFSVVLTDFFSVCVTSSSTRISNFFNTRLAFCRTFA